MAVNPGNVLTSPTGAVAKGPTTTTAPTGTSGTLTGFTDLGAISEDGVTFALNDESDATPLRIWQDGAVVRTLRTASEDNPTVSFTLVESSKDALETYFGQAVTQSATEGTLEFKTGLRDPESFVLTVVDGENIVRLYIPRGVVSSVGEIAFTNSDAIGYEVTIDCELDAAKGYNFKLWTTSAKTAV